MHAQWQALGQDAEHDSFEYNTARRSRRRFHTVSVCAKLSYARDSWQTLAQTIHGPRQAWGSFVQGSAVKTESRVSTLKTLERIRALTELSVASTLYWRQ